MLLSRYQRLIRGAKCIAFVVFVSSAVQVSAGSALSSAAAAGAGQIGSGTGNSTGYIASSLGHRVAFDGDQGGRALSASLPSASLPAGRAVLPVDAAFLAIDFPKIFEAAGRGSSAQRIHPQLIGLGLQTANLPSAGEKADNASQHPVAPIASRAVEDTRLFALIFKEGQDAWSERQIATIIVNKGELLAADEPSSCPSGDLCHLRATPIPGTLWLFTALLIGLFGVGYRSRHRNEDALPSQA